MTSTTDRYGDLRAPAPDAALDALLADLHDAYTAPDPPPELRAAIARLAHTAAHGAPTVRRGPVLAPVRRFAPRRPRARILTAAGLLAAAVGIGAAIADSGLVERALDLMPGGADGRYAVTLNQARGVCGFTVTLRTAYADANRLVVGYEVSTPPTRRFGGVSLQGLAATDARGTRLEPLNSSADSSDPAHMAGATRGDVQEFDTGAVLGGSPLRVRLAAPSLYAEEIVAGGASRSGRAAAPPTPACETDGAVTTGPGGRPPRGRGGAREGWLRVHVEAGGTAPGRAPVRAVTVPGPFVFDITVPLSPKVRAAAPHVSGTSAHGTTITLERLVATPTEARLYVRGPDRPRAFFIPMIDASGTEYNPGFGTPLGHGLWVWRFFPRPWSPIGDNSWLFEKRGAWTVKVLTDSVSVHNSSSWSGSVTFTVTAP